MGLIESLVTQSARLDQVLDAEYVVASLASAATWAPRWDLFATLADSSVGSVPNRFHIAVGDVHNGRL